MLIKRFEVYLINLDPTIGNETKKTRPCVVVSPDEMNFHIKTVIIAPLTTRENNTRQGLAVRYKARKAKSSWIR